MMVRTYGVKPYKVVVVHGGPGGLGSAAGLARGLSASIGVIEPIQSKYTIDELIEELNEQINQYCMEQVILVGHSWGAWLVAMYTAKYPQLVKKMILISSGPLDSNYVKDISRRRKEHFSKDEAKLFDDILIKLKETSTANEKDSFIYILGALCQKSDNYKLTTLDTDKEDDIPSDGEMYSKIFPEVSGMRQRGELLDIFNNITCPISIIHGDYDPHPIEGLTEPLSRTNIKYKAYLLEKCGHTPWKEEFAYHQFYEIMKDELK
jgi:pimeloyl-ACP methyl ester carboxylesterase